MNTAFDSLFYLGLKISPIIKYCVSMACCMNTAVDSLFYLGLKISQIIKYCVYMACCMNTAVDSLFYLGLKTDVTPPEIDEEKVTSNLHQVYC